MTLAENLRAELGLDELAAKVDRLIEVVEEHERVKRFYSVDEARQIIGVHRSEVDKMLADGRLWKLEGLDSSRTLIPHAALESLQRRPS